MSLTAAAAILGFGLQAGMEETATEFYRHRATMVDLDAIDDVREGAPEVGGRPVPTFPYKGGPIVAGGFTLQPRFEDTLGILLYGLLGNVETDPLGGGDYADINTHKFLFATETSFIPWMSFRKYIPKNNGIPGTDFGQVFTDCKVLGGTLVLPNDGPVGMRVDALGRMFALDHSPSSWTWANQFESWESIPVASAPLGYIKVDNDELPVVAANIAFQNVPLDPRQERVFGSPYLEDVTVVQRRLAFDLTVKWRDPDLYAKMLTGTVNGTTWTSAPYTGALDIKTVSSVNMPTESIPYSLRVQAGEVMLSQVGGITLAANQSIMMRFAGVALDPGDYSDYCSFTLTNKAAGYVLPS